MLSKNLTEQEPRHSEPLAGEESAYFSRRPCRLLNFDFCTLIFDFENVFQTFSQNEPNFFTTKYALSISKTQKWRPKS